MPGFAGSPVRRGPLGPQGVLKLQSRLFTGSLTARLRPPFPTQPSAPESSNQRCTVNCPRTQLVNGRRLENIRQNPEHLWIYGPTGSPRTNERPFDRLRAGGPPPCFLHLDRRRWAKSAALNPVSKRAKSLSGLDLTRGALLLCPPSATWGSSRPRSSISIMCWR